MQVLKANQGWRINKLPELIKQIEIEVGVQVDDVQAALYGEGNFQLAPGLKIPVASHTLWQKRNAADQTKLLDWLRNGGEKPRASTVVSSGGELRLFSTPRSAKKPCQKTRVKSTRTTTVTKKKRGKRVVPLLAGLLVPGQGAE